MPRQWTVRVLTCLAMGPLLLAGCSQAEQASTSLPPTAAPTTTVTTSALSPAGPADFPEPVEARQKTPEGVKAFTDYYIRLIDRSAKYQDSSALRTLSRNCAKCAELADSSDELKAAGHKLEGGDVSLISTGSAVVNGDIAEISTYIKQSALTVRDATGVAVPGQSSPDVRLTGGLRLIWDNSDASWLVTQFDADPV